MIRDIVERYFFYKVVRYVFVCLFDIGQSSEGNAFQTFGDFEEQVNYGILRGEGAVDGMDGFLVQIDQLFQRIFHLGGIGQERVPSPVDSAAQFFKTAAVDDGIIIDGHYGV